MNNRYAVCVSSLQVYFVFSKCRCDVACNEDATWMCACTLHSVGRYLYFVWKYVRGSMLSKLMPISCAKMKLNYINKKNSIFFCKWIVCNKIKTIIIITDTQPLMSARDLFEMEHNHSRKENDAVHKNSKYRHFDRRTIELLEHIYAIWLFGK